MSDLKVSINIEQLTIDGFSYNEAWRVQNAFQQELQRVFSEQTDAQSFKVKSCEQINCEVHSRDPEQIGARAARSLARQLVNDSWQKE